MINSLKNIGHKASAAVESVLYVRNAKIAKARVIAAGAVFGGLFLMSTAGIAEANQDFNAYANSVGTKVDRSVNVISYICYIGGAACGALGIVDLKKHVENPSQTPMKNGLAKVGFGGMLLAFPTVLGVAQTTTDSGNQADFTSFTNKPQIN